MGGESSSIFEANRSQGDSRKRAASSGAFYLTGALSTGAKFPGRLASRAAPASSSRPTGVVCGADVTIPGDVSHSFAIAIIASANAVATGQNPVPIELIHQFVIA